MMSNFEKLHSMSMDNLATWIDKNGMVDHGPWLEHFDDKYCAKCESVMCKAADAESILGFKIFPWKDEAECAYCEVHHKCRFFPDIDDVPGSVEMIKLWLEAEAEE